MRTDIRKAIVRGATAFMLVMGMSVAPVGGDTADAAPAGTQNPCAQHNPCAVPNPCAAKNPCAANPSAANPCAPAPFASLGDKEVQAIYAQIASRLQEGYAKSAQPIAKAYAGWTRFNRVSYVSATHGNRYVNNFANPIAADNYGKFEKAGPFPVGSILAKDSFRVQPADANPCATNPCAASAGATEGVEPGPLFIMEKMPAGFSPSTNDWRYSMIMPDGTIYGTTKGAHSDRVAFCAACHSVSGHDSLFFLPKAYR